MSYSKSEKSDVKKALFISLSNIGDCILTLPVLDALKENFPEAVFTVLVGPKARELFVGDGRIERIIVYDKKMSWKENAKLTLDLRKEKFDCVVDLRNTAIPLFLKSRIKTTPLLKIPRSLAHMRDRHMQRIKSVFKLPEASQPLSIITSQLGRDYIKELLEREGIKESYKLICVSPGAANHIKQWRPEGFAKVCDKLIDEFKANPVRKQASKGKGSVDSSSSSADRLSNGAKIIFVGDEKDKTIVDEITSLMKNKPVNLCGKTTLRELAFLLSRVYLLISCDSAVMHMGSYLNIPVFAIFGPTDSRKYGPWSGKSFAYKTNMSCSPCEKSGCSSNLECMKLIDWQDLYKSIKDFMKPEKAENKEIRATEKPKKILIIRTDRIGDVILTTPVIKALRQALPDSFISIMVSPLGKDIVEGNPYLNEVIVYDKKGKDKGIFGFLRFVLNLREKKFDLCLNLHTKKRTNLIGFLAGAKERIGYDNNKFSFLLTKRLKDARIEGKKHEAEYCLDILKEIGINTDAKQLFMPLKENSEKWAEAALRENNIRLGDNLVVIHPDASCPSKRWPIERFAQLCNKLIEEKNLKVAIISGQKDSYIVKMVKRYLRHPVADLSGKTTVSQLASLINRAKLLISNDSGPVHIAAALGIPVIAIFGRSQPGLSPARWGPLGEKNIILHKNVGCKVCLAHNCKLGYVCLSAISVRDVLAAVDEIIKKK